MLRRVVKHWISAALHRRRASRDQRRLLQARRAYAAGAYDAAIAQLEQISATSTSFPAATALRGFVASVRGDITAAEACFRASLGAAPNGECAAGLGDVLLQRGEAGAAAEMFHFALELGVADGHVFSQLGLAEVMLGRFADAAKRFARAHELNPRSATPLGNLGVLAMRRAAYAEAIDYFTRATEVEPNSAKAWFQLGAAKHQAGQFDSARDALERTLALDPNHFDAASSLVYVLRELGMSVAAEDRAKHNAAAHSGRACAHADLAQMLCDRGDYAAGEAALERALSLDAEHPSVRFVLAQYRLSAGDFATGWPAYEARYDIPVLSPRRGYPIPEWQGENLAGRSILVYGEQGLGDEIMFASCFDDLITRAERVVIACDPRVAAIFTRSFSGALVVGESRLGGEWLNAVGKLDFQIAAGSLPSYFRSERAAFARGRQFLYADPDKAQAWRVRLDALGGSRKIGVSWRGGAIAARRAVRSIPPAQLAALLAQVEGEWVSLQYGDCAADLELLGAAAGSRLHHWQDAIDDYDETAALVASLDAVVSVCTSLVHLAGALGRPCFVATPAAVEWPFLREGETMPWYPSVSLLRQARAGDWSAVLDAIAAELR